MSKKYLIIPSLFSLLFFSSVCAEGETSSGELISPTCKYKDELKTCFIDKKGIERSVEEFVCPSTNSFIEKAYQVVLDMEFKTVDEKMIKYITELDAQKDRYFGPNAKENVLDGINKIEEKFSENGEFGVEYQFLCDAGNPYGINALAMDCVGGKTPTDLSKDFFSESLCENLYIHKLEIYKMTAYRILQLNKSQVQKDNKKEFFQERRTKYDAIYDAMMVNLGYLERVWRKWKSKIKYN